MGPRIGIPLSLDERERWRAGRNYLYIDHAYPKALAAAGAQPVLLPVASDPVEQIAGLEGLLLPGGDDFAPNDPGLYPADVVFDEVPEAQLEFDRALLAAALDHQLPVLGICYGAQLLALHHGGRLHYHLPTDLPGSHGHGGSDSESQHPIQVEAESHLHTLLGEAPGPVNSRHHQAVADPGPGLRICAQSPDGVIEAIESTGAHFELGVQWHPESLPGPAGEGLIRALVSACERG